MSAVTVQEILNGATVKPLAPHGRHLIRNLPLVACGRDENKGNGAVALTGAACFPRPHWRVPNQCNAINSSQCRIKVWRPGPSSPPVTPRGTGRSS